MFRSEVGEMDPRLASEDGTSLFGLYTLSGDPARMLFLAAAVEDSAGRATISGLGRGSCRLSGVGIIAAFLSASISDLFNESSRQLKRTYAHPRQPRDETTTKTHLKSSLSPLADFNSFLIASINLSLSLI